MRVEIWSDVVCPWCYIGKRRFEHALDRFAGRDAVEITYRPYQLDPTAPPGSATPVRAVYARKFGGVEQAETIISNVTAVAAAEGIEFRLDRAVRANTLLAHRVLWLAGRAGAQSPVKEALLRAYFTDGLDIGDPDVVAHAAAAGGLDPVAVLRELDSGAGLAEVAADLAAAAEAGITAVPTFVFEGTWAVPGAQDADVFVRVLERLATRVTG